ncbi:NYN domain-containing protein [Pseudochelatococcus sp. B33]
MDRVAIFVDAGYLFAQGSNLLTGKGKQLRADLSIAARAVVEELTAFAETKTQHCSLLRIYWYDGTLASGQLSSEQSLIADLDNVKLRLGFINSHGQQKGVDSLIVTDLIELSRLHAISDAILLAGDEDIRVGVQIAQNYGVRVHLLGIHPARGSQSRQLLREADTTSEWDRITVEKFLSVRKRVPSPLAASPDSSVAQPCAVPDAAPVAASSIDSQVLIFIEELSASDVQGIGAFWKTDSGVPSDIDRAMLAACRSALGRDLTRDEIRQMRNLFKKKIKSRIAAQQNSSGGT